MEIPTSLESVDASWLESALREAGNDIPSITGLSFEPMPDMVGALGEIGVFDVAYGGPTSLPSRFVGKRPLDHDAAKIYNSIMQFYIREHGFYRDLAYAVPMNVPTCWVNLTEGDRHFLLIDFVDGVKGDILAGTTFAVMKRLVGDLAKLHGRYWMDERLKDFAWVLDWREPSMLTGVAILQQGWADVTTREPELVPSDLKRACQVTLDDVERWLGAYADRPWTFIHGDYELDNMLFRGDDVVIVDWQGCMRSFPGADLGFFLASSATDESVEREDELLEHYRSELAAAGGPAWSPDELVEDLAWGMIHYVRGMTLPYSQDYSALGEQGKRLEQRFGAFMHRCVDAAVRWNTADRVAEHM